MCQASCIALDNFAALRPTCVFTFQTEVIACRVPQVRAVNYIFRIASDTYTTTDIGGGCDSRSEALKSEESGAHPDAPSPIAALRFSCLWVGKQQPARLSCKSKDPP